jgi:hypothetical protein
MNTGIIETSKIETHITEATETPKILETLKFHTPETIENTEVIETPSTLAAPETPGTRAVLPGLTDITHCRDLKKAKGAQALLLL